MHLPTTGLSSQALIVLPSSQVPLLGILLMRWPSKCIDNPDVCSRAMVSMTQTTIRTLR